MLRYAHPAKQTQYIILRMGVRTVNNNKKKIEEEIWKWEAEQRLFLAGEIPIGY